MPIITSSSNRLTKMVTHASRRLGKPILIKTNAILMRDPGGVLSASFPERNVSHKVIPIYVDGKRALDERESVPTLTPPGEFCVAEQISAHLAYQAGYANTGDIIFALNESKLAPLGEDISRSFKVAVKDIGDHVSQLSIALISHNIAATFGFDPASYFYENKLYEHISDMQKRPNFDIHQQMKMFFGVDPLLYPDVVKVLMFEGIATLARLHTFLTEELREELLRTSDPLMARMLREFISKAQIDQDYNYMVGDGLMDWYSRDAHISIQERMLDYAVGEEGFLRYQKVRRGETDDIKLLIAATATNAYDFYSAYSTLCTVKESDVSGEIAKAKRAMFRTVSSEYPNLQEIDVHRKIAEMLAGRNMLPAAIIYQEDRFGLEADLDRDPI